jgi:hypothetical protein
MNYILPYLAIGVLVGARVVWLLQGELGEKLEAEVDSGWMRRVPAFQLVLVIMVAFVWPILVFKSLVKTTNDILAGMGYGKQEQAKSAKPDSGPDGGAA